MARFDQQLVRRSGVAWRRQGSVPLCEVCGIQDHCEILAALTVMGRARGAEVAIPECGTYQPVIGFQSRLGVHGAFNTFRRGNGWANRLSVGVVVGLYDMKNDAYLGSARVVAIHRGLLRDLLEPYAHENHLMRELPRLEAPEELQKVLKRLYGTNYGAGDQAFNVLSLEEMRA